MITVMMVLAVLTLILLLAFFRASIWGWLLASVVIVAGVAILNSISGDALMVIAIILGVIVLVLGIPFLRRLLVSHFILKIFRQILPQVSQTEQEALDAGTVWWDGELFSHLHVKIGPQHLMTKFKMLHDLPGIHRRGRHQILIRPEPRRSAVVQDEAVFAQHQSIARAADVKRREHVGIGEIEQAASVGALDIDLAERRDIANADVATNRPNLANGGVEPVLLAGFRKV